MYSSRSSLASSQLDAINYASDCSAIKRTIPLHVNRKDGGGISPPEKSAFIRQGIGESQCSKVYGSELLDRKST